ncbi:MAG: TIR domain-containing protein [Prevotella sp.]|jgi:hypothetical protein|nr:TIR domain-containing protein [Prevotella sp.]
MKESQKSERMWDSLLSKIESSQVIPIVGSELFCINVGGQSMHLNEYIIKEMADSLEIEYEESLTFTELDGLDYKTRWNSIDSDAYYETTQILKNMSGLQVQSSDALRKLLSIDKFRIILTTSFDDWTFKTMEEKWGKGKVKELSYKKHTGGQDIDAMDVSQQPPLLYHIFGKADIEPHSFVLTEDDLLDFLHDWMNDNYRPKRLTDMLREKYLLLVGCNYPNWLFRFFIHSMRNSLSPTSEKKGLVADSKLDKNLIDFLSRINVWKHDNTSEFIDELVERWNNRPVNNDSGKRDVFISYASEDYTVAMQIAQTFEKNGAAVWLDEKELNPGDKYENKIKQHIMECNAFVPILSQHSFTPDRRYFKKEWNWGKSEAEMRGTKQFIYPIFVEEIDKSSHILPEEFRNVTMIDFSNSSAFESNIQKIVRNIRS